MIVVFVVFTTAVLVVVVIAIEGWKCKHALSRQDDPDHFAQELTICSWLLGSKFLQFALFGKYFNYRLSIAEI